MAAPSQAHRQQRKCDASPGISQSSLGKKLQGSRVSLRPPVYFLHLTTLRVELQPLPSTALPLERNRLSSLIRAHEIMRLVAPADISRERAIFEAMLHQPDHKVF